MIKEKHVRSVSIGRCPGSFQELIRGELLNWDYNRRKLMTVQKPPERMEIEKVERGSGKHYIDSSIKWIWELHKTNDR